jgi:hypothetical protein
MSLRYTSMSKNPAAVALGKMTSAKKAESSRRNGALGGYRKHKSQKPLARVDTHADSTDTATASTEGKD